MGFLGFWGNYYTVRYNNFIKIDTVRLDIFLASHYQTTRNRAQFWIDSGLVLVNKKIITKASYQMTESDCVEIVEDRKIDWVSRSAVKLDDFLEANKIIIGWFQCLDVGSSTGGFTQVLLSRWAQKIVAVEIGTNQLHKKLRWDPRIESHEQTDIRDYAEESQKHAWFQKFDLIIGDISWCPLRDILPSIIPLLKQDGSIILLYKPQFEVSPKELTKGWVVHRSVDTQKILDKEVLFWKEEFWIKLKKMSQSTLAGEAGNEEYLVWVTL